VYNVESKKWESQTRRGIREVSQVAQTCTSLHKIPFGSAHFPSQTNPRKLELQIIDYQFRPCCGRMLTSVKRAWLKSRQSICASWSETSATVKTPKDIFLLLTVASLFPFSTLALLIRAICQHRGRKRNEMTRKLSI